MRQETVSEVESAKRFAARLLARLLGYDMPQRRLLLANVPGAKLRAVCECLLQEARSRRHSDREETLRLATLSVETAERLGAEGDPTLAEALAELGNARRLGNDFAGAERDLSGAGLLLERCGGDPLAVAGLLSLRASLAEGRRQYRRAIALADRSFNLYASCAQTKSALNSLIQVGTYHGYAGSAEVGIDVLGRALELAEEAGDAQDLLHIANNLAGAFIMAGLVEDASAVVDRARELCVAVGSWMDELRLDWLAARHSLATGRVRGAARVFEDLARRCRDEALTYEQGLLWLDLAGAQLRLGHPGSARRLAAESVMLFRDLGIERERQRAHDLLRRLCDSS